MVLHIARLGKDQNSKIQSMVSTERLLLSHHRKLGTCVFSQWMAIQEPSHPEQRSSPFMPKEYCLINSTGIAWSHDTWNLLATGQPAPNQGNYFSIKPIREFRKIRDRTLSTLFNNNIE